MGTLDELFEVLTLKQTGKVQPDMPVVLFGKKFWKDIINWDAICDYGVISQVGREGGREKGGEGGGLDVPVVMFRKKFWKNFINWDTICDYGVILQVRRDALPPSPPPFLPSSPSFGHLISPSVYFPPSQN